MFKGHPKGLLGAALANMGERFGFYTMMAILSLFLMSKFGLDETKAGIIYSVFYFSIYILAFVGGLIADRTRNYKGTILVGLILMATGYVIMALPTPTPVPKESFALYLAVSCFGLLVIAFGNGLFKGNLQALVGQMYDNEQYGKMRDSGFSLFYMFINVGAIFAPIAAVGVRNWWLESHNLVYRADLPDLCHAQLGGTLTADGAAKLTAYAAEMQMPGDLAAFAARYLDVFATGFHYAFAVALVAMGISMAIYLLNRKGFPDRKATATTPGHEIKEMDVQEVKRRLYALFAVFGVVIFFWFSFHQNGLTLTFFAKDYTFLKSIDLNLGIVRVQGAELFQSINPFFVVLLTPVIMAIFAALRARGREPSTPKKIAIGMGIAAAGYVVMTLGSLGLPDKATVTAMGGLADAAKVTPFILIGTYFVLTVAELFISPLGISFVSKVAPPKLQGVMQGCWLGATALGNQLLFIGAILYKSIPIWLTWTVFVGACLISMVTMLVMVRWLERVAK